MKFSLHLAIALGGLANSVLSVPLNPGRDVVKSPKAVSLVPAIDVKIQGYDNSTHVSASVTNIGPKTIKLLKQGTVLDNDAVEKFQVYCSTGRVPFEGIRKRIRLHGLGDDAFQMIGSGETVDVAVDLAMLHDMTEGGSFTVVAEGAIPYADDESNSVAGKAVPFKSNVVTLNVDGAAAARTRSAYRSHYKRAMVLATCNARSSTPSALELCSVLSIRAANAALDDSKLDKFVEYFKSSTPRLRSDVNKRFLAIAKECSSVTGGASRITCIDVENSCDPGGAVLAYSFDITTVYCPSYYTLQVLSPFCHDEDQTTTTIHEMTHIADVWYPPTLDVAYGYDSIRKLSSNYAQQNADTFALYANALLAGC